MKYLLTERKYMSADGEDAHKKLEDYHANGYPIGPRCTYV